MTAFPRRILVTGAAGFLGRILTRHLESRSDVELVLATDRVFLREHGDKTRFVARDVREPFEDLMREYEIEAIAHHAFQLQTSRNEQTARRINVEAAGSLAEEALFAKVGRFVYPSSTSVYGAWPDSEAHTEDEPLRPASGFQYPLHKAAAERTLRERTTPELTTVILRSCVILGPGADNFISRSLGLRVLPLPSGTNPPMQFLHVDDYVKAVEAVLGASVSDTYNIAGLGTVTVREFTRIAGSRVISVPEPLLRWLTDTTWKLRLQSRSPASGITYIRYPWLASTTRIAKELGWHADHTTEEAVRAWAEAR
ncbi:MAG: NAD-dependent epimerase/dehydratase family protein [Acidimicrobiia bacterium]